MKAHETGRAEVYFRGFPKPEANSRLDFEIYFNHRELLLRPRAQIWEGG